MKAISKIFGKSKSKSIIQQNGSLPQSTSITNLAPQSTKVAVENSIKSNTLDNRRLTQASINSSSDITHSSSSSSSHSKSPDESLDIKEKLEGQLQLKITIKHLNECIKLPVDRSKPLLDILVLVAAKYSFNPADYIINIESGTKQFTKSNSNPVGLLGADHVVIMPKPKSTKARPSSVQFNWSRRFRVYLPHKQQTVLRILVTEKFRELKFKICEEKSLDPCKYILVKHFQEGQQPELIDLDKTPDDYDFNYKDLQLISVKDYEQLLKQFTSNSRFNHSISLYMVDDHDHHHSGSNRLNVQSTNDWSRSTPNINISLKPMKQSDACSVASSRNGRHYKKKPAPPPPPSAAAGKLNGARSVQNLSVISDENEDNCSNITEPSRTPTLSKMYSSFESSKTNNSDLIENSNETIIKSQPISSNNNQNNNIVSSRSRLTRQNSGSDSSGYCETLLSNTPTDSNSPEPPTTTLKNVSTNSPTSSELKRNGIVTGIGNSDIIVNHNKERKLLVQDKPIPKTRHSKLTSSLSPVPSKLSSSSFKNGQNSKKRRAPLPPTIRSISTSGQQQPSNDSIQGNSLDSYTSDNQGERVESPCTVTSEELSPHSLSSDVSYTTTASASLSDEQSSVDNENNKTISSLTSSTPTVINNDDNLDSKLEIRPPDGDIVVGFQIPQSMENEPKEKKPEIISNDQQQNLINKVSSNSSSPSSDAGKIVEVKQQQSLVAPIDDDNVEIVPNNPVTKTTELKSNESSDIDGSEEKISNQINQQDTVVVHDKSNVPEKSSTATKNNDEGNANLVPIDENKGTALAKKKLSYYERFSKDLDSNKNINNNEDDGVVVDEFKAKFRRIFLKFEKSTSSTNRLSGNKVKPSAAGNSNNNTAAAVALVVEADVHDQASDHCDVPKDNKIQDLTSETTTKIQQKQEEEQLQPKETTTNNLNPIDHHRTSLVVIEDEVCVSPDDLNKNNTKEQNEEKEAEQADKNIDLNEEEKMKNMNGNNPNGGIVVITDWKRRSSSTLTTSDNNNNHNHNGDVAVAAAAISSTSSISNDSGDHEQLVQNSRETLENKNIEKQVEITLNELNETLDLHQRQPSPPIQNSKTLTTSTKVAVDSNNIDESIGQRLPQQRQSSNRQLQKNPSFNGENNINQCIGNDVDVRRNQPHYQSASSLKTSTSSISSSSLGRTKVMINNSMSDNNNNSNNVNGKCSPLSSNSFSVRDGIRKFNTVNEKNVSQQDLSSLRIGGGNTINTNILRRSSSRLSNNGDDELFAPKVTRKLANFQIGSFKSESSVDIYERSTSSSSAMAAKPPISNVTKRIANINPKIINNNNNNNNNLNNGRIPSSSSSSLMPNKTIVSINSSKQQVSNGNGGGNVGFIKPKYAKSISVDVMENNHNYNNNNNNDIKQEQKVHVNQAIAINPKTTIIKNDKSTATTIPINTNGYVNGSGGFMINNKSHNQQPQQQQQKMLPNFLQELKTKSQNWGQNRNDNILMENDVESMKKQKININGSNDHEQFPSATEASSQNYNHLNHQRTPVSNGQMSPKINGIGVVVMDNNDVVDGVSNSSPAPPPPPPPPPSSIFSTNSSVNNRLPLSSNLVSPKGWQQNKSPETSSQHIRSPLRSVSIDSVNQKQQNGSGNGLVDSRDALLNEIKKFHSNSKLKKVANNQPFCVKYN